VVTDAVNAGRLGAAATGLLLVDEETFVGVSTDPILCDTSADDSAQLYYTSATTGLACCRRSRSSVA
jgi:acetyl-CoA synthetase